MVEKLLPNKKSHGCKWVYKIKYNSDGTIERFNARLMILGNHQVARVDYSETFIPIAKMVIVHVFLAITAAKQWELHQIDVHNAFLHEDLEEEVFMKLPPGLHKGQPGKHTNFELSHAKSGANLTARVVSTDAKSGAISRYYQAVVSFPEAGAKQEAGI
nr:retrovirus-related Pol polyprotein from transposon TNT 1-94 [Tanacetum cinerariifolium]